MTIDTLMGALHWLAGFVVLAEGLNKIERTNALAPGVTLRVRLVLLAKVIAWICLVLGAAGALVRPFVYVVFGGDVSYMHVRITDRVSVGDFLVLGGFALLIVRSRFKENLRA